MRLRLTMSVEPRVDGAAQRMLGSAILKQEHGDYAPEHCCTPLPRLHCIVTAVYALHFCRVNAARTFSHVSHSNIS